MRRMRLAFLPLSTVAAQAPVAPATLRVYGLRPGTLDGVEREGRWRIGAESDGYDPDRAVALTMYRRAQRASDKGYRFLALSGGRTYRNKYHAGTWTFVRVRPVASPDRSPACGKTDRKTCYVASVDLLLRQIGGPDDDLPGVAAPPFHDRFDRVVYRSPYGAGADEADCAMPVLPPPVTASPGPFTGATSAPPPTLAKRAGPGSRPSGGRSAPSAGPRVVAGD